MKHTGAMKQPMLALLLVAASPAPAPDPVELHATIAKLVSFGTRHTLSTTTDPARGIGAARHWVAPDGSLRSVAPAASAW